MSEMFTVTNCCVSQPLKQVQKIRSQNISHANIIEKKAENYQMCKQG